MARRIYSGSEKRELEMKEMDVKNYLKCRKVKIPKSSRHSKRKSPYANK